MHFSQPKPFIRRRANDHRDGFGVRQYAQDVVDYGRKVVRDRNDRVIFGENGTLHATLLDGGEHHRGGGKELLPVPLHEARRGRAHAQNDVGGISGKEGAEVTDK